jgi:hypothetical protein
VGDLGSYTESRFVCLPEPSLRSLPSRDVTLRLERMEPHGSQMTVASVVNGEYQLQARAIIFPTGAGVLGPRRLRLDPSRPDVTDGNYCAPVDSSRLDLELPIPDVLPPDAPSATPTYQLDFWSDLNRNGARDPAGTDHTWGERICDNGDVLFQHNIMFDSVVDPSGDCMTSADCMGMTGSPVCRFGRCAADAADFGFRFRPNDLAGVVAALARRPGEAAAIAQRLRQLPFVLTVSVQDRTVGYFRTELECLVDGPLSMEEVVLPITDIIDGGAVHDIQVYVDTQRNGTFDADCDPRCRNSVTAPPSGRLEYQPMAAGMDCTFPEGFFQSECATPE